VKGVEALKAIQFDFAIPKWAYSQVAGRISKKEFYGPRSMIKYRDVPEPEIRGPRWLKLRNILSGFCGSDLGLVLLHDHPTNEVFSSYPFTIGHENCSIVEEVGSDVKGFKKGDRVVLDGILGCAVREIDPPCGACASGYPGNCENFAEGDLSVGMFTGYCADTGGGWSKYFLAHESQVYKISDKVTDEQGVMMETLCSSLHPVFEGMPESGQKVLVIGCGVIGMGVIASIRALGIDCHITGIEPVPLNQEKAREKGADEIIDPSKENVYERTRQLTGAHVYKPTLAKPVCMGGFDRVFDCVGSTDTINEACRLAAGRAKIVIIGIQIPRTIDWTPIRMKGLTVVGDYGYGVEDYHGKRLTTFEIAIDLVTKGKIDISDLITHRFRLDQYKEAIEVNMNKAAHGAIKTIFDLSDQ
jgi:threonine dehydrogenase-like Zn-dependent dehydrogenase